MSKACSLFCCTTASETTTLNSGNDSPSTVQDTNFPGAETAANEEGINGSDVPRKFADAAAKKFGPRSEGDKEEVATQEQEGPKLDGTWATKQRQYHCIEGRFLKWADGSTTLLKRDPSDATRFVMTYRGQTASASMDKSGTKLEWDDGDTWIRAGLDGFWKGGMSGIVHVIEGSTIRNRGMKSDSESRPVTVIDSTSLMLELDGAKHTARMDQSGQMLTFDDGDIWQRVGTRNSFRHSLT
jgi:hypothetical protein